jgi:hypothetical protein
VCSLLACHSLWALQMDTLLAPSSPINRPKEKPPTSAKLPSRSMKVLMRERTETRVRYYKAADRFGPLRKGYDR